MAGSLTKIDEARRIVLDAVAPRPGEPVELERALGRTLAEDTVAAEPIPAFDGSAMDGFAIRAADAASATATAPTVLRLVAESRAGTPATATLGEGEAAAISTGAMVPRGADAVVRIEDARTQDQKVQILVAPVSGQDIRRAGEDIQAGETVLRRGRALGPAELGVLASLGRASVQCARRPRVSVLTSGDELLPPDEPLRPGAVRDSNSFTIAALVRRAGAEVMRVARVADDPLATRAALADALGDVDVVVVCGGVSVGVHDHVRPCLDQLGVREAFWGIALKPGRPTWFGTHDSTLVFGLPGNPVSAMVAFILLVAPALRALLGLEPQSRRLTAAFEREYEKRPGRAHAVRCRLTAAEDGWRVQPTGPQGSHILTSMLAADALAIVPSEAERVRVGERVEVEPLWRWREA